MKNSIDTFYFNNKEIPYYHFVYKGDFHKDLRIKNNHYFEDGTRINEFFSIETHKQYNFNQSFYAFNKAMMMIVHYFPDYRGRDLDNYIYKPVIDSIRRTRIIEDDSWEYLGLFTLGDFAEKERLEVYVVPYNYTIEFLFKIVPEKFNIKVNDLIKIVDRKGNGQENISEREYKEESPNEELEFW